MNFKPLRVNDQYYHIYISFNKHEINKFFHNSLASYEFTTSFKKLPVDEQELITNDVKTQITQEIESMIMNLDIIIISEILYLFRGKIQYDTPLFVIAKICTIPEEVDLISPDTIINLKNNKCADNALKVIIDSLLISNNFYDLVEVSECNSASNVVVIEAVIDGAVQDLTIDGEDEASLVDFDLLFGYNIDSQISTDFINLDNVTYAKIKKIYLKQPQELTDEIVKNINLFNIKNKDEFIRKITSVIETRQNRNFAVNKILDYVIKNSNIKIEDEVIDHFMHLMANEFECSVEEIRDEWNNLDEDHFGNLTYQITKQYIVHHAYRNNANYMTDEYYKMIKEEYNLHRALMLVDNNIQEYEMFLREQLDFIILFNFFSDEGLILK